MDKISNEDLAELKTLVGNISPGPYEWGMHPEETQEGMIAWMGECLAKRDSNDLHMVGRLNPEEEGDILLYALTGNGPNSANNAQGILVLLMFGPALIAEVEAARKVQSYISNYDGLDLDDGC